MLRNMENIYYFEEIESTHKYLKENFEKYEDGAILIAEKQINGIGSKGRNWYTGQENNIAMSILYKPKCNISKLAGLTIDVAKTIKKIIWDLYKIELKIKEPNDLMLNGKKICGILCETNMIENKINFLIISVGLNVNETEFTDEIQDIATSLKNEFKKDFSKEDIIINIIEKLKLTVHNNYKIYKNGI